MPKVRVYDSPQVSPGAMPFAPSQAQSISSGVNLSGMANQVNSSINQMAEQQLSIQIDLQDRKNQIKAKRAYIDYGDRLRELQTSLTDRKRMDALGVTVEGEKKAQEIYLSVAQGLENDRQREMFESVALTRRSSFLDTLAQYEASEMRAEEVASADAVIESELMYASENYGTPGVLDAAMESVDLALRTRLKGSSEKEIATEKEKLKSQLHLATIDAMLSDKDPALAQKYFRDHEEEIVNTPGKRSLAAYLDGQVETSEALDLVDEIHASGLPLQEQLKMARERVPNDKPQLEQTVVELLKSRYNEAKSLEADALNARYDDATAKILDHLRGGGSFAQALRMAYEEPNGRVKRQLVEMVEARQRQALADADRTAPKQEVDYNALLEARMRVDGTHPTLGNITSEAEFFRTYLPKLGKEFEQTLKYWKDGGARGSLTDSRVRGIYETLTGKRVVSDQDQENYNHAWNYILQNVPKDREPTDEEITRQLAVLLTTPGERVQQGGWDWDMSYQEALQGGVGDQWLPKVDKSEKAYIKSQIEIWNDAVTSDKDKIGTDEFSIRRYKKYLLLGRW